MTEQTLKLLIITPENIFYNGDVYMVSIPGAQGELGILAGHMNLIVELQSGPVKIYNSKMEIIDLISVAEGFAEISNISATLLVQEASRSA